MNRGAVWWIALPLVLAALLVAGLTLLARYWLQDDLRPEVASALQVQPSQVADEDNLYYALLGAGSRGEDDIIARGMAISSATKALPPDDRIGGDVIPMEARFEASGDLELLCRLNDSRPVANCLQRVRSDWVAVRELLQANTELMRRYHRLLEYRAFETPAHAIGGDVFLSSRLLMQGLQLDIARLHLDLRDADQTSIARALDHWTLTSKFWRFLLAEADDGLIGKMVAVAGVNAILNTGSHWLWTEELSASARDQLVATLAPFAPDAMSMRDSIDGEFRFVARMVEMVDPENPFASLGTEAPESSIGRWFGQAFFQILYLPNQTRNELFDQLHASAGRRMDDACAADVEPRHSNEPPWPTPRNMIGRILISVASPDMSVYLDRLCDLEGLRRLHVVRHQMRASNIAPDSRASFLEALPENLSDPYGGPMKWDAREGGLRFDARDMRVRNQLPLGL